MHKYSNVLIYPTIMRIYLLYPLNEAIPYISDKFYGRFVDYQGHKLNLHGTKYDPCRVLRLTPILEPPS